MLDMSVIYIKDLIVEAKHGVYPHEKAIPQRFKITAKLDVDTKKAQRTDKLEDTVDWNHLRSLIIETAKNNSFDLMERLADELARKLLSAAGAKKVNLTIDKLDAWDNGMPSIQLEFSN